MWKYLLAMAIATIAIAVAIVAFFVVYPEVHRGWWVLAALVIGGAVYFVGPVWDDEE